MALTKADIDAMFPDCHHGSGYGTTAYDRDRCEGMLGPCRRRQAHRAGLKLLETLEKAPPIPRRES